MNNPKQSLEVKVVMCHEVPHNALISHV